MAPWANLLRGGLALLLPPASGRRTTSNPPGVTSAPCLWQWSLKGPSSRVICEAGAMVNSVGANNCLLASRFTRFAVCEIPAHVVMRRSHSLASPAAGRAGDRLFIGGISVGLSSFLPFYRPAFLKRYLVMESVFISGALHLSLIKVMYCRLQVKYGTVPP